MFIPWKFAGGMDNLVLQALHFHEMDICCKFPDRMGKSLLA
jgi:hypothetical protein